MNLLPAITSGKPLLDTIHHCDALTLLKALPDASIDLIATDPPYNVDKAEWDTWPTDAAYLDWLRQHLIQFKRVLKSNGSLYLFATPRLSARVEVLTGEYFNILNNIRWVKREGWHNKTSKEEIRGYLQPHEAVIFAEQFVSADGRVYQTLKDWFRDRAKEFGVTLHGLNSALGAATNGGGLASGYFGDKVEFQLPTEQRYKQMQTAYPIAFNRPYDELRCSYEALRRPFNVSEYDQYTDTWHFKTVQHYPGKHPCEKPLDMMRHIIRASSKPGAVVLDCFAGSGATLDAASLEGRHYIGCDMDSHWVRYTRKRLAQPYTLPLPMFAGVTA